MIRLSKVNKKKSDSQPTDPTFISYIKQICLAERGVPLTLCILMDFPKKIDTIKMRFSMRRSRKFCQRASNFFS